MRHYYAIEYAYGAHVVNNGVRADSIRRFSTRLERDWWVSHGAKERDALMADDPRVRTMNHQAARGEMIWPEEPWQGY